MADVSPILETSGHLRRARDPPTSAGFGGWWRVYHVTVKCAARKSVHSIMALMLKGTVASPPPSPVRRSLPPRDGICRPESTN